VSDTDSYLYRCRSPTRPVITDERFRTEVDRDVFNDIRMIHGDFATILDFHRDKATGELA